MSSLADLRAENLREQREGRDSERESTPEAETPLRTYGDTDIRNHVRTEVRKEGSTPARTQVSKSVRPSASKPVSTEASKGVSPSVLEEGRADDLTDGQSGDLAETIRTALAMKRTLPSGVKSTADMSVELSKRAKQYALDKGVTVRQILLECLDAFLTAEGR